jgi:Gas vesicle synthesis protein GvpO
LTRRVVEQLAVLTGRAADGVSRLEPTEDGWLLHTEVVDLERAPPTTSVLATYEVRADHDGEVTPYERIGRYTRNQVEGDDRRPRPGLAGAREPGHRQPGPTSSNACSTRAS